MLFAFGRSIGDLAVEVGRQQSKRAGLSRWIDSAPNPTPGPPNSSQKKVRQRDLVPRPRTHPLDPSAWQ